MKRMIRSVLVLLMSMLMLISLAACQKSTPEAAPAEEIYEPENASALWEKIDGVMDSLQSYESTITVHSVFYNMGYEFVLDAAGCSITAPDVYYEDAETLISCEELSTTQTTKMVEAYCGGKLYIAANDGTYDQKFCSEMTVEEYEKTKKDELVGDIDIADCTGGVFSKEENGWSLKFSGYTKKTVDSVLEAISLSEELLGAPVADMQISLDADEDFHAQQMKIVFSFTQEEGEPIPEFSVTAEFSKFNEAVLDPAKLNAEAYVLVEDVRVLEQLSDALEKRQNAASGNFTLDIKSTTKLNGQTDTAQEKDIVSYGKKNGAYYYNISADLDGTKLTIAYQNGVQTVVSGGETQTAEQSADDAKAFVDGLIDHAGYNQFAITAIEKKTDDAYLLKVAQPEVSAYSEYFTSIGISLTSASQELTVTMTGEELRKLESKITLTGAFSYSGSNATMTMTIESVVDFTNPEDTATDNR